MNKLEELQNQIDKLTARLDELEHLLGTNRSKYDEPTSSAIWDLKDCTLSYKCPNGHFHDTIQQVLDCKPLNSEG